MKWPLDEQQLRRVPSLVAKAWERGPHPSALLRAVKQKALVPPWRKSEPKDPTLPAVLEFQWPSTAIANAPIPRSARGITWMITSMVFLLIAVAGLIPIDRVVQARGIVVSQS